MSLHDRMKQIYNTPSYRTDDDYAQEIPRDAKEGVLLYYREVVDDAQGQFEGFVVEDPGAHWLHAVIRQLSHAHLEFNRLLDSIGLLPSDPLETLTGYLLEQPTPPSRFLDFLELSLGPGHQHPDSVDNDFIDGLNVILDRRGSPYLLTRYASMQEEEGEATYEPSGRTKEISAYPSSYLKHSHVAQQHAVEPALRLLTDPAYTVSNNDFLKALKRHKNGDHDGVLTSCAATLEGAIKATARARGWTVSGNGLGTLFQSFASRSTTVPDQLKSVINYLHQRRSKLGDAHGHAAKDSISAEEASFCIALTAALVSFLAN